MRLVVLDHVYSQMDDPKIQTLFAKYVAMKLRGYRAHYPFGTLSVDTSDLISTHTMLCFENGKNLEPIWGYRSVTLSRCEMHRLTFPIVSAVSHSPSHLRVVQKCIDSARRAGKEICYDSSITFDPEVRKNLELKQIVTDAAKAYHKPFHEEKGHSNIIVGGVTRFKMNRTFDEMGYLPFEENGLVLPPIKIFQLFDEEVQLFVLGKFADLTEYVTKYRSLWDNRIEFMPSDLARAAA